ncbi:hypothetical protein HML84_08990 [Alcanivorax sp. IO_7]|nr:hypothetical protein HML84_08990 [Alcanivorax sp. IO_7]
MHSLKRANKAADGNDRKLRAVFDHYHLWGRLQGTFEPGRRPGPGRPWLVAAYAGTALALPEVGEGFKVLVLVAGFGGFFWLARGAASPRR